MTYKKFTALARRVREESTPDVADGRLPAEEKAPRRLLVIPGNRARWAAAAIAVAACVAVVVGTVLGGIRPTNPPPLGMESSQPTQSSGDGIAQSTTSGGGATRPTGSGNVSLVLKAPAWYAPGSLSVEELVCDLETDTGGLITKAGVLDVTYLAHPLAGHEGCGGVYYDTVTGKTICCWHTARALLEAEGLGVVDSAMAVYDYQPTRKIVLFQCEIDRQSRNFLYNEQTQTLKEIHGPLHHAGRTMGQSLWPDAERTYSLLQNTAPDGKETLLLVNLLTGEMTEVAEWAHKTAEDGYFSPTGKYVVYTKGVSDMESLERQTVVYTIATGKSQEIQGQVRHILPDDSGLVVETPDGLVVFSGDTGKTVPFTEAGLPEWYRYQVRMGRQYANDCRSLSVVDLLTGQTVVTLSREVYAWQVDAAGRYLYYYVRGEAGVVCRDIVSGQEFTVSVSEEFVEMQRRYNDKEIQFYLLLDEEAKTLNVSYIRYDRPRQDSQAIQEALKGDVGQQYTECVSKGVNSLADFAELIERFPEGLTFGQGDGFVYLDCRPWLGDESYWVEDYRTNTFYFVSYNNEGNIVYINSDVKLGVLTLAKDAKARTDALLKSGKIPVVEAAFDYGRFVKNGKLDQTALAAYNRRTEVLMAGMDYYIVYTKEKLSADDGSGIRYEQESAQDLQELREFLDFVNTLSFRHTEDYWDYQDGYRVKIDLETETVWFGRYGGKPVVVIGTHYAHMSEEDYTRWMDWAMGKAEECLYPSDEPPAENDSTTPSTTTRPPETVQSGMFLAPPSGL